MTARAQTGRRIFPPLNPGLVLLVCVTGLVLLGLLVLFSASSGYREDPYYFLRRQVVWLGIALAAGGAALIVDLEKARRFAWPLGALTVVGLVAVLVPGIGVEVNGSRRWLDLGPMRLQVSEFAKIALVFTLAHYLGVSGRDRDTFWRGFVAPCLWIGLFFGLILLEPDYGTAFLCAGVGLTLLFLGGVRLVYVIPAAATGVALFATAVVYNPVRWQRIVSFMDIEGNRTEGAYQLWQALLAFGVGGVGGVGLGNGRQQMAYLPEAHTDFIFAIIGEELGLIFTLGVALLFFIIFAVGMVHLKKAPNLYQFLLAIGCLLLLTLQAVFNMGVVTGCLPTKGLSLPFISYGGSNLVAMFILVGILLNTHLAWKKPAFRQERRRLKEIAG